MEKITGAEALMRSLKNEGVKTIFGYPGGAIMPVFDALYDYTRGRRKLSIIFSCVMNRQLLMLQKVSRVLAVMLEYAW